MNAALRIPEVHAFRYETNEQETVFAAGEIDRLGDHIEARGVSRVLLCTSGSYMRNGTVEHVRQLLADRLLAVYHEVRPHVPEDVVRAVRNLAVQERIDALVALGGGSAIGTGKAVCATGGPEALFICIPTTYAGSEMTPVYGVTRAVDQRKVTYHDPSAVPRLVLYDPAMTSDLPPDVTAGTGINALAHCVEGLYSRRRTPVTSATALAGAEHIYHALPTCLANGHDLDARTRLLTGAYLGGTTIANAGMALHHAICHSLGGRAQVPHGAANAIMLPHVMRFNLMDVHREIGALGPALGLDTSDADAVARAFDSLCASLPLPQRLRDAGVPMQLLPELARMTMESPSVVANPVPIRDAGQIENILRAAW